MNDENTIASRKRAVRIVKHIGSVPCVAACTACGQQFQAPVTALNVKAATEYLQSQFDAHQCGPVDVGKNAANVK
jgi:hypothetical protein